MNPSNMTNDELARAIEHDGSPLALALLARLDELEAELREAKEEIVNLENGPLCTDDDHADIEDYRAFFEWCVDWTGCSDAWSEKREIAAHMREAIAEAMPI